MANDQQEEPVPKTIVYGGGDPSKSYAGVASKVKVSDKLTVTPRIGQFNLKNKDKGVKVRSTDIGIQGAYKINKNITLHTGYNKRKTKVQHSGGTGSSKGKGFNFGISIDF
jgi:hypothetical protein|tara:strand:- start:38 stop:370 length:333 start_codon:yes stop_codon:yes gene_type:complete